MANIPYAVFDTVENKAARVKAVQDEWARPLPEKKKAKPYGREIDAFNMPEDYNTLNTRLSKAISELNWAISDGGTRKNSASNYDGRTATQIANEAHALARKLSEVIDRDFPV